ncbi:MAG: NAD(P)/FAD-dependent oxidoreductase [Pseudomonadales bacterium]|nr:NAD(P)/FAD-dependent oxidoreductase [Pseudomonadales bacterium]
MPQIYDCQIIGGGPAGMSMMIALENEIAKASPDRKDRLKALLEADAQPGGQLGRYCINANTDAAEIVSGIGDNTAFSAIRDNYLNQIQLERPLISLARVNALMLQPLAKKIQQILGERLQLNSSVARINKDHQGFHSYDQSGQVLTSSRNLIIACGGSEPLLPELASYKAKTIVATEFLKLDQIGQLASTGGDIVIIGASHSGFSCAWRLLHDPLFTSFREARQIQMCHRGASIKMRGSREFAKLHQMHYQDPDDICPDSGIVYRHAGLRKDAKNLYLDIKNKRESRVQLVTILSIDDERARLESAGLIIQCCGFSSNFPAFSINGKHTQVSMQSQQGELHDAKNGQVIDGLFASGLGVNIIPQAEFRGEASFTGSVNGLQIYPISAGPSIIEQMLLRQDVSYETSTVAAHFG